MLDGWTLEQIEQFRQGTITFQHKLAETGLFTDAALIELLEKHPIDQIDVCSMSDDSDPEFPNQFMTGDFRGVNAQTLLEAAKANRIFINLRRAMNSHPEYQKVLKEMFLDLSVQSGCPEFSPSGGILISSPISQTPYHFDKTETILWHIRGEKRIYIYPATQEFISDENYEAVAVSYRVDDLPYKPEFEDAATAYDLQPGQGIAWPLNAPHRVDNSSFCVSVTTEYPTHESKIKNNNMVANSAIRGKMGMKPSFTRDGVLKRYVKAGMGYGLRKAGYIDRKDSPDIVSFAVDKNVKGFIKPTKPFARNF